MTSKQFPNKYSATCADCGTTVDVGVGLTHKGDEVKGEPKWVTVHVTCPTTDPEVPAQPEDAKVGFAPTAEQAECIKLFATGEDLVIQAGAGAGKTSTLKLLANHALANGRRGQYLAYNAKIVKDVRQDMPGNVACNTMHSIAFAACGKDFADRLPSKMSRQPANEVAAILGIRSYNVPGFGKEQGRTLAAGWLASKALGMVERFCHTPATEIGTEHLEYIEGIDPSDPETGERTYANNRRVARYLLPFAQAAWADMTNTEGRLRVTHDTYLKSWSLNHPVIDTDFILLDEAQDADPVQEAVVSFNRSRGVQVVCVGDEQQVLYEWRGAVNAMADFEGMGAKVSFLSQSFRFGEAVADVANGLLSRLDARLRVSGFGPVASTVGPVADPDAILCRSNAGAVRALIGAIGDGRKVHLVGGTGEIVSFCKAALRLQDGQTTQHAELAMFSSWDEVTRYVEEEEQGADLKLNVKLVDQFGAQAIINALDSNANEAATLAPGWDGVVISTAHKSKGLQWGSVQIADDFKAPKEGDLSPAELRLAYVACTRAKRELDLEAVAHFTPGWTPQSRH
jgi:hypothetical protein